ncbi:hypothetical protein CCACVL1_06766 [Corchorus capsularis]|uniref:Uncharacterized protein n=1 Tax=Corchorus capsularis TaxID=210143 RepID=A0A1R3JD40_COCAP|nr:hypothetical protein CCACVL1_06766 [Corchorus capsularis]
MERIGNPRQSPDEGRASKCDASK